MVIHIPVKNIRIVHPALAECFDFHVEVYMSTAKCPWAVHKLLILHHN